MKMELSAACLLTVAGLACPALAQDSVSNVGGLPGDAVNAYDTDEQINRYVVDLTPHLSSWNNVYGVAPLVKLSQSVAPGTFYTHLMSANATSNDVRRNVCNQYASYALWTTPGAGVNGDNNDAPGSVSSGTLRGAQFSYLALEFEGDDNNVIGGTVNYDPANPTRLYVSRIMAAQNGAFSEQNTAQFGGGAIDAAGNTVFRADDFGVSGPNGITGNNYYRVNILDRNTSVINKVDGSGFSDTGDWLVQGSGSTYAVPNLIPEDVAGRSVLAGSDFNQQYVYEATPGNIVGTMDHLSDYEDDRGTVGYSGAVVFDGSVATLAMFGLDVNAPQDDDLDSILLWGVDEDGAVTDSRRIMFPLVLTDNDDGFMTNVVTDPLADPIRGANFGSQVVFRGGNGQTTVGYDAQGNLLVAAPVHLDNEAFGDDPNNYDTNPMNAIAVARFAGGDIDATPQWTTAGYNAQLIAGAGKQILDGPNGQPVGQQVELLFVTGGSPLGPSISSPMMDGAGNLYFIASVQLYVGDPDPIDDIKDDDLDNALLRAVYNPATFSYQLELITQLGDVFDGQNSGTPWQINFIDMVDSNSIGSAAPFTGNIVPGALGGLESSKLSPADPRNLGGLVFSARIVYDTNGDEDFDTATDENYRVLLYVGAAEPGEPICVADANGDANLNILDFVAYQGQFQAGAPQADMNCDGNLNILDFVAYQTFFQGGCN